MISLVEKYVPHLFSAFVKAGGSSAEVLHLPFLCIFGRSDGTLSFDGANVFPDQIQSGILKNPQLSKITNRFKMEKRYDTRHTAEFHIHIELKNKITPSEKIRKIFPNPLLKEIIRLNPDFRESYSNNKTIGPKITLYPFDHPLFRQDDAKCKNIYSVRKAEPAKREAVKKKAR